MKNEQSTLDFRQIDLFPQGGDERVLMRVRLEAESVLDAWYELALVSTTIGYLITKRSGAHGRGYQSENWFRRNLTDAEKKYSRILAGKVNPRRSSPRKYRIVESETRVFS